MENERKTYAEAWFEENVANDADDLLLIGDLAARSIHDKLCISIGTKPLIAMYSIILETILDYLKKKQEQHFTSYQINICNVISISYNNLEDDESEKMGNFMPFIQQIAEGPIPDAGINSNNTIELCTAWNSSHITEQPDAITEIATAAVRNLKDRLAMRTADRELIMPIFCIMHENIIAYIKLKRADIDATTYTLNVAGIYEVRVSEADDGSEIIEYPPVIYTKKSIKDDDISIN